MFPFSVRRAGRLASALQGAAGTAVPRILEDLGVSELERGWLRQRGGARDTLLNIKAGIHCRVCGDVVSGGAWKNPDYEYSVHGSFCKRCINKHGVRTLGDRLRAEGYGQKELQELRKARDPGYAEARLRAKKAALRKRERTNMKRYGVKNPQSCAIGKERRLEGIRERLGVDNPMDLARVKKKHLEKVRSFDYEQIHAKIRETNLARIGVAHHSQTRTNRKKMRDNNPMSNPDAVRRLSKALKKTWSERKEELCKFGDRNPMRDPKTRAAYDISHHFRDEVAINEKRQLTWMKKYGVPHFMMDPQKRQELAKTTFKVKIAEVQGLGTLRYQGYELPAILAAVRAYGKAAVIPCHHGGPAFKLESGRTYMPDIVVHATERVAIEVKSLYTISLRCRLKEKARAVTREGYRFSLVVALGGGADSRLIRVPEEWITQSHSWLESWARSLAREVRVGSLPRSW